MDLTAFSAVIGKLKRLKRTGWVMRKVPQPESVAEHSFGVALLALIVARHQGLNEHRAVEMALLHDLGETVTGDIVTQRGNRTLPNHAQKLVDERAALQGIVALVGQDDLIERYDELQANTTPEARLVNQLDKLEAALQAGEYAQEYGLDLSELIDNADSAIYDPELRAVLGRVKRQ